MFFNDNIDKLNEPELQSDKYPQEEYKYILEDLINKNRNNERLCENDLKILATILRTIIKSNNYRDDIYIKNRHTALVYYEENITDSNTIIKDEKIELEKYITYNKYINKEIEILQSQMNFILPQFDKNFEIVSKKEINEAHCEYKDCCETCEHEYHHNNLSNYCQICEICISLRRLEIKESFSKYHCENECVTCKEYDVQELKRKKKAAKTFDINHMQNIIIKPNEEVDITPIAVKSNSLTLNIINNINDNNEVRYEIPKIIFDKVFVYTKDLYFNVFIFAETNSPEAISNLKYIFTYLMCGASGKNIFPNEPLHSKALTFMVKAGIYTIVYNDNLPVLSGLLRYQHIVNQTTMTVKKLELYNKSKVIRTIIKATQMPFWQDRKHHFGIENIKNIIENITKSEYFGSNLENFY